MGSPNSYDRIPPELAKTLFAVSIEKAKKGMGGIRIARELSSMHGLNICPGTINHWIYGDRRPRLRNIFSEEPSPALSYIIGSNIGDGCTLPKSGSVKLEVTDIDFAQTFNSKMAELFSRDKPNKILVRRFDGERLPLYIVKYTSRQLVELLRRPLKDVLDMAFAFPREFLRGFFDAEGHVDVAAKNSFGFYLGAENSNRALLMRIKQTLRTVFHINSTIYIKRKSGSRKVIRGQSFIMRKSSFSLLIRKLEDLKTFGEQIGFSITRKHQKLKDALLVSESYCWKNRLGAWNQLYSKHEGEWIGRQYTRQK